MFGSKILPAILIIVPATVLLSAQASLSEPAAEECKSSPGANTPRGAHWYYRINRAKQHCWYLGVLEGHTRAAARTPEVSTTAARPQKGNAGEATHAAVTAAEPAAPPAAALVPAASVQMMPAPAAAAPALPEPRSAQFATRWPENLPSAEDLDQREPTAAISNSYADGRDANDQTTLLAPKLPLAAADRARSAAAGETALRYFSIAGALAIPLLLTAGWAAKFTRRPPRPELRDQWRTIAARLRPRRHVDFDGVIGLAPLMADRHGDADWHVPTPTDPAYDLKTSLAELMRDLRRAGAFEPAPPEEPADGALALAQAEEPAEGAFALAQPEEPADGAFAPAEREEPADGAFALAPPEEPADRAFAPAEREEPADGAFAPVQPEEPATQSPDLTNTEESCTEEYCSALEAAE